MISLQVKNQAPLAAPRKKENLAEMEVGFPMSCSINLFVFYRGQKRFYVTKFALKSSKNSFFPVVIYYQV